jgi:hypothetical protein
MTAPLRSDTNHSSDNLDQVEAHIWGELKYSSSGGSYIKVKGTGTEDQEAFVVHGVGGFNVPSNSDAEVLLLSGSSDSNKKWAIPSIPFKQQRQWPEGVGGIQSPVDPKRAVEINKNRTYVDDDNFATRNGIFEVKGNTLYIRGNVVIQGDLSVGGNLTVSGTMNTNQPTGPQPVVVPGFSA